MQSFAFASSVGIERSLGCIAAQTIDCVLGCCIARWCLIITYAHKQLLQLQRMLSRAEADRDELQAKLSLTTASNRSAGDATTANSKGDAAGVKVLQSQLRDSEKKCAALLSSNTMLESELDNYKKYIQKVVQRYQETVQQLQAELKAAKGMPLL
jgi:vacuolar-type H+-ATPase subunit D/Vma8